ncbi:IS1 family transposase [Desulfovibrio sp. ZJ200]|uniref:IS1 family transposase n=1 Tax=Desulfovibrio sp. ZJ200 TaxID=2709792 RepID=UPI00197E63C7|nr:IS1 family transposase [Desulfovibrio sp. ZJ200]
MEAKPDCPKCHACTVYRSGKILGKQRYRCKNCGFQFTRTTPRGRPASEKALAVTLYTMGLSLSAIARIFHVSPPAVLRWVRTFAERVYEKPEPGEAIIVELDEMWHFLKSKKKKLWIWKACCRDTGQLIDRECGGRDQATLHRLMERLKKWKVWFYCTDKWKVYPLEIAENDLLQGKSGTVRIERNNCRQRHWFARFRRKSVVVSRSLHRVDLTMALFARFHLNGTLDDIKALFS